MVNVEWCHYCDQPECRKPMDKCEYGRKVILRQAEAKAKSETHIPAKETLKMSTSHTAVAQANHRAVDQMRHILDEYSPEPSLQLGAAARLFVRIMFEGLPAADNLPDPFNKELQDHLVWLIRLAYGIERRGTK